MRFRGNKQWEEEKREETREGKGERGRGRERGIERKTKERERFLVNVNAIKPRWEVLLRQ